MKDGRDEKAAVKNMAAIEKTVTMKVRTVVRIMLRLLLRIVAIIPPRVGYGLSSTIGSSLLFLNTSVAQVVQANLSACFSGLNEEQRLAMAKQVLTHTTFLLFEFGYLTHWSSKKILGRCRVEGKTLLDEAQDQSRGVILLVPHFGNWEVLSAYLGANYPLSALYAPPKFKALEELIVATRQRQGGTMLPVTTSGLRGVMHALANSGVVAILPDQVPDRSAGGCFSTFYGEPVQTMTLAHRFARRSGALVLMGSAERIFENGALNYIVRIEQPRAGIDDVSEQVHVDALNASIERIVHREPTQYQWGYKRFKRAIDGGANLYRRQ